MSSPPTRAMATLRTRPPATTPNPDRSFVWVLLLALAGGLVLNLMPCVLPILSLKVLSLAQSGESPSGHAAMPSGTRWACWSRSR
jgi:thiol:disulfide interchange protein DsbD